jgi:hypothetical protein
MSDQIFCSLRQIWVAASPEEVIRQSLIHQMINQGGYPFSGFAIEKTLQQMPHLYGSSLKTPKRRADLIFFAKNIHSTHSLYPLLLIECKSIPLTKKEIRQAIGYNFYVKAYFIAVANSHHLFFGLGHQIAESFLPIPSIPSYLELLNSLYEPNF